MANVSEVVPGWTAEALLQTAIRTARPRRGTEYRWVAVRDYLKVGSTTATALCRWAGVDPMERVRR